MLKHDDIVFTVNMSYNTMKKLKSNSTFKLLYKKLSEIDEMHGLGDYIVDYKNYEY